MASTFRQILKILSLKNLAEQTNAWEMNFILSVLHNFKYDFNTIFYFGIVDRSILDLTWRIYFKLFLISFKAEFSKWKLFQIKGILSSIS